VETGKTMMHQIKGSDMRVENLFHNN